MVTTTGGAGRGKRLLDRIAWGWILIAPLLGVAGAGLDLVVPAGSETVAARPEKPGSGMLLRKLPDGLEPLPMLDVRVEIEVTGPLVHGTVTQSFLNPTGEVIDTVYVFPLPERAAVHGMEMRIGSRRIRAVVKEREEAAAIYDAARREGRKAALTEQERPNLFVTSVANVNPGETVEVRLEYLEELQIADGEFGLAFPLTFTPRFSPGGGAGGPADCAPSIPADLSPAPRATVQARLRLEMPSEEVVSPSHTLRTWWEGETLVIEPQEGPVAMDRDFLLRWRPLIADQPASAAYVEDREDGRYALLMLVPPEERAGGPGLPTETLFVVDVSGSMAGPSIEQARPALVAALRRLAPEDTFDVFAFNDGIRRFRGDFVAATPETVESAATWVESLEADGGTMIHPALQEGLRQLQASMDDRVQRIVLLTDGAVSNEAEVIGSLLRHLGPVRLHTLGIGCAPNRYLMRRMAAAGHGLCEFIADPATVAPRMERFLERIGRPVTTGLTLRFEGAAPDEVYPSLLPDLHIGEPLLISAKFPAGAAPGRVVLSGRTEDGELSHTLDLAADATSGSGVATRWARAKVGDLTDRLEAGADLAAIRKEVIAVATSFGIVSRFTSLVAVEDFPSALGDARATRVPSPAPRGSEIVGVLPQGGTLRPLAVVVGLASILAGLVLVLFAKSRGRC